MVKLDYLWKDVNNLVKLIDNVSTHGEDSLTNNCIVEVLALCHKSLMPLLLQIN
jgi:hypothetical protein